MLQNVVQQKRFLKLYLLLFICAVVLLLLNNAGWCSNDELFAAHKLLETYRVRLQSANFAINRLHMKLNLRSMNTHKTERILGLPVIFIITPTYARLEQKAELVRMSHALLHVANTHWIVVEDSGFKTPLVTNFLQKSGINYTHLNVKTPADYKLISTDPNWLKPRGVLQRNAGLDWLRQTSSVDRLEPAVVYFADDDNTYSFQLFEEMRQTIKVSVWPVGIVGALRYESPIVAKGKVTGWFTYWKPHRPFAMDMAGFAINIKLILLHPDVSFSNAVQRGYQESTLLTGLRVSLSDLEPKANMCTEVLVWHTRSEKQNPKNEELMVKKFGRGSDPNIEV